MSPRERLALLVALTAMFAISGCVAYPEIGHRAQAQTHGEWCSCQDIAYAQHSGGSMPGRAWR